VDDDSVIPIRRPEIIATVGGMVDETRVTLAVYGESLDPDEVTSLLGVPPTSSHRKGDRRSERSPPHKQGAWFLTIEGRAPTGPDELIRTLLAQFPMDRAFWQRLNDSYLVWLRVGITASGWNRGFDLEPETLARIAATGGKLGFDLYFYGEEDVEAK
jgi:hypothetical protein